MAKSIPYHLARSQGIAKVSGMESSGGGLINKRIWWKKIEPDSHVGIKTDALTNLAAPYTDFAALNLSSNLVSVLLTRASNYSQLCVYCKCLCSICCC